MLSRKDQKFIKSLKVKKYRTREECFLVEGAKNVQELLNSSFKVEMVIGTENFFSLNMKSGNHRNEIANADLLSQLGTFKSNEDCIAIAKMKNWTLSDVKFDEHIFVLDGVGDPGNVGTIIRTLDWFGFNQIILSPDCAEFYHPKVINSTMGSFTRINAVTVDLETFFKHSEHKAYAADMKGAELATVDFNSPSVIIMGSESHGISEDTRNHVSQFVTIPQYGKAESLNVGVATGILAAHLRMSR
ncbi:RNA methyltransferase [Ekhidna sp.]|uniref:TrmH family RNA methyltransferase n=1 Tax=Ekhidna sp. TaxID=2608089 RepID=UPI0032993BAF